MQYYADLHLHSHYSRATSKDCDLEHLYLWAAYKGISLLGTSDFTHSAWRNNLKAKLRQSGDGVFTLKPEYMKDIDDEIGLIHSSNVHFMLSAEISCIYKRLGRTRKVHNLVFLPDFSAAEKLSRWLSGIGNVEADGRPILKLDSYDLLQKVLEISDRAILIPAHIWTPHFSVYGSMSGFDSLGEAFDDLLPNIYAVETGLSSDPAMNWRVSELDKLCIISASDAHSPSKLGRELSCFNTEMSYEGIHGALRQNRRGEFLGTVEFYPEEGKYHYDGHRKCQVMWRPDQTRAAQGVCPVCGKRVTLGVLHRVEELADRKEGEKPLSARPFRSLIPLQEIVASVLKKGVQTKAVSSRYFEMLKNLGNELFILTEADIYDIDAFAGEGMAAAISNVRTGNVSIVPGYDGEYGKVEVL